jgi:hypothetical protein
VSQVSHLSLLSQVLHCRRRDTCDTIESMLGLYSSSDG